LAERPVIEAVLLDAGGTMIRLDFEWMAETVTSLGHPITAGALRRAETTGRRRYDASKGRPHPDLPSPPLGATGDTDAYFAGTLEAAGVPASLVPAIAARFMARQRETGLWTRPMEGIRDALAGLDALGLRRAVVSNSDGRCTMHLRDCDLLDDVEFVIDSHVVGVEKPDRRIFDLALDRLGIAARRALFVGDILCIDEAGARAAGVHFVLIDPWGDYAPEVPNQIRAIAELPVWIARHFDVARPREAAAEPTPIPAARRAIGGTER
jgi:putative hydrolase of the HAD superfamily